MARNTNREALNYDELFAGEVGCIMPITVGASQTVKRGDLLECVVTSGAAAANWAKPASAAVATNFYMIALEDATTGSGETATINAARNGYFNAAKIAFGGSSVAKDNKNVLIANGIFLRDVQSGAVSAT